MRGSQGRLLEERENVFGDVVGAIAERLGYGGSGVECVGVAGWVGDGECPKGALEEAGNRLAVLLDVDEDLVLTELTAWGETAWSVEAGGTRRYSVSELVDLWREGRRGGGEEFPLWPVVRAFMEQPRVIVPEERHTGRVIPAKLAMVSPGDSRGHGLFSPAAHVSGRGRDQLILPGFERADTLAPVLPLLLYDMGAGDTGDGRAARGAPLPLRLFVESILSVQMGDRTGDGPVALRVPLRLMLKWLYPGERSPRPSEYWPRLMRAAEVLDRPGARIPWYDSKLQRGGIRRVVSVGEIPRGPSCLDDEVRIIVDLPPGSETGPQVSDRLRYYGVKSAVAYRILLHLAYRWHHPGRTLVPARVSGRRKRPHWVRVYDPARYEVLTDDELVGMAYPTSSNTNRRTLLGRAQGWVKTLEGEGELQIVDGKILPPRTEGVQGVC